MTGGSLPVLSRGGQRRKHHRHAFEEEVVRTASWRTTFSLALDRPNSDICFADPTTVGSEIEARFAKPFNNHKARATREAPTHLARNGYSSFPCNQNRLHCVDWIPYLSCSTGAGSNFENLIEQQSRNSMFNVTSNVTY